MDTLLILLFIIGAMLLIGIFRAPTPAQVVVVQAPVPESVSGGLGCLPLILIGLLMLVLLGVIRFP